MVVKPGNYPRSMAKARRRMAHRDAEDVELLALNLKIPVWPNGNEFAEANVQLYTTARLLKKLSDG